MTTENNVNISSSDLITIIGAAAKQRTAMRQEMKAAQEAGDLRTRNRIAKVYHPLSDTLMRLTEVYLDSL